MYLNTLLVHRVLFIARIIWLCFVPKSRFLHATVNSVSKHGVITNEGHNYTKRCAMNRVVPVLELRPGYWEASPLSRLYVAYCSVYTDHTEPVSW